MKKSIEKYRNFEIVWMSVSRMEETDSQGQELDALPENDHNNVIIIIDGWGWSRRETNRVGVLVLTPGSEEWGSQLADSEKFLEELRACVRFVLRDWEGKSDIEVRSMTYAWADA